MAEPPDVGRRVRADEAAPLSAAEREQLSLGLSKNFGALRTQLSRILDAARGQAWMDAVDEAVGQRVFRQALLGAGPQEMDIEFIRKTQTELTARGLRERDERKRREYAHASQVLSQLYANAAKERANAFLNEQRDHRKRVFRDVDLVARRVRALQRAPLLSDDALATLSKEVDEVQQQVDQHRSTQRRLKAIPGLRPDEDAFRETTDRLNQLEGLRRELNEARRHHQKLAQAQREQAEQAALLRGRRRGERVESYAELQDRREDARRLLAPGSGASAQEQEDARAFLAHYTENKKQLAKKGALQADLEAEKRDLERLKTEALRLEGSERRAQRDRIRHLQERIQRQEQFLAQGRYDAQPLDASAGLSRVLRRGLFGTKATGRRVAQGAHEATEHVRKGLRRVRNLPLVDAAASEANERATLAGHAWLWRAQASRYRAQEEAATRAQRTAKSSLWAWWYRFSRPVRTTLVLSLTLAPLLVPFGILQVAGWGVFVVASFALNALASFGLEILNLVYFGALAGFNIMGSLLAAGADNVAGLILGQLGFCQGGLADPACPYHSLPYRFGVQVLKAPPLIDPRLFFPTQFNNNALASVALDLLGHVDPLVVVALVGALALATPLFLMEESPVGLRVLVGVLLGLLMVPAFMTQAGLLAGSFTTTTMNAAGQLVTQQRSLYAYLADLFRTGVGNTFTRPALALAQAALDAALQAQNALPGVQGGNP